MAASETTPEFHLSQFGPGDRPSWIDDYNSDMRAIDRELSDINQSILDLHNIIENKNVELGYALIGPTSGADNHVEMPSGNAMSAFSYIVKFKNVVEKSGNIDVDIYNNDIHIKSGGKYLISFSMHLYNVTGTSAMSGNPQTIAPLIRVAVYGGTNPRSANFGMLACSDISCASPDNTYNETNRTLEYVMKNRQCAIVSQVISLPGEAYLTLALQSPELFNSNGSLSFSYNEQNATIIKIG